MNQETIETYQTPTDILVHELPELLLSKDAHDLEGAVLGATYLSEQNPELESSKILKSNAEWLQTLSLRHLSGEIPTDTNKITHMARYCLIPFVKLISPLPRTDARINSLVAVERYRVDISESIDEADLAGALEVIHQFSGLTGRNLTVNATRNYYKHLLEKESLTLSERQAIIGSRMFVGRHTKHLVWHWDFWKESRRLEREGR